MYEEEEEEDFRQQQQQKLNINIKTAQEPVRCISQNFIINISIAANIKSYLLVGIYQKTKIWKLRL